MYLYHSLLLTRRANMSTLQQAITLSLFGYFFLNFATCGETNKMDTDILRQMLNQETIMRMAMETEVKGLKKELKVIRRITENFHDKCSKLMSKKAYTGGEVYVRWGKSSCGNSSVTICSGQVGGSNNYQQSGGAVDHLCLPPDPIYDRYDPKMNNHAFVFGAEFDVWNIDIKGTLFDKSKYTTQGVSCSVCRPRKQSTVLMIPGRNACYEGMTKEYSGYLMAGYHTHKSPSEYICVDGDADIYPRPSHKWGKILYPVESVCDGPLRCGQHGSYINGAEMTCVVCSL